MIIEKSGVDVKVRMIGIDAPESAHSDEYQNTPEGELVSEYVRNLLEGQEVYLEYDAELTDKYDRLLAYVYLYDKETMVERILLEEGYVQTMTIRPNTRYENEFFKLERSAKKGGAGFWGTGYFD